MTTPVLLLYLRLHHAHGISPMLHLYDAHRKYLSTTNASEHPTAFKVLLG